MSGRRQAWALLIAASIAGLTFLHYSAGHESGASPHHLYRRLFYLPILVAAFGWGLRGGLVTAGVIVVVYAPHAFGMFGLHPDPASTIDKVAEMLLYVGIGGGVGAFVDRERGSRERLQQTLDALRAAQGSLVAAEHQVVMGFLTAGLAHEIRNPLGAIRGSAELLRDGGVDGDRRRRTAELLVSETERLDGVLSRFLRYAAQEPPRSEPVNLSDLAAEVVDVVSAEAMQRGLEVTHLRSSATPTVSLDGGKLRQVLLNLVVNAMQVQSEGGRVRVVSGLDEQGDRPLFVRVEDAGPGIPHSERGDVFRPYYTTRPGGTGLGLAISRTVAAEHGGTLEVADSSLGGASFALRLPLRPTGQEEGERDV